MNNIQGNYFSRLGGWVMIWATQRVRSIICIWAQSGIILLKVICICEQIAVPVVFLINDAS